MVDKPSKNFTSLKNEPNNLGINDAPLVFNAIYSDGHFEKEKLGALLHKGGAAGKIYLNLTHPDLVAKIFHEKNKSHTNRQKLEAMLHNRPNIPPIEYDGQNFVQIAWPEAVLEDDEGFCVGYLMPLIKTEDAVSLDHLMQKAVRQKLGLPESYSNRLYAAYNVASMVAALHKCGHYIVDLKPANVSVYKENMLVAVYDCDGFSIRGENGRYPAEFVSEEYIYPEGMQQNCEDMGEEQDKFALAVILFKLLNNGIHPFSGTPRKADDQMLPLQTRIEQYHYAYGLWPDSYQSPHPYSMHGYFDKKTLELFDRSFLKNQKRPSAKEWQEHLEDLFRNLKSCKKNPDHVYFTAKGCGLCAIEEKFKQNMAVVKEEKQMPVKIRGLEISELSKEKNDQHKKEKHLKFIKLNKIAGVGIGVYLLFWGALSWLLEPFKLIITSLGYAVQILAAVVLVFGIYKGGDYLQKKLPLLQNQALLNMLKIYALVNILVAFVILNDISSSLFKLALK